MIYIMDKANHYHYALLRHQTDEITAPPDLRQLVSSTDQPNFGRAIN